MHRLSYYQFVPFFLLLQAIAFQLPYHFWKSMATHSGMRVHVLVNEACNTRNIDWTNRQKTIKTLRKHLENALRFHRRLNRLNQLGHATPLVHKFANSLLNVSYSAAYVNTILLVTKLFYFLNAWSQFRLLNWFMVPKENRSHYGNSQVFIQLTSSVQLRRAQRHSQRDGVGRFGHVSAGDRVRF